MLSTDPNEFGPKLRIKQGGFYVHRCPGCNAIHTVPTEAKDGPNWEFNYNPFLPSFQPALRISMTKQFGSGISEARTVCHYVITDGKIFFMKDCKHHLAGQTVDLPDY